MKKAEDQNKSFSRARLGQRRREKKKKSQLLTLSSSDIFSKSLGDGKVVVVEANADNWQHHHSEGELCH